MLTAAQYREYLQQATFAHRLEHADTVTAEQLACDVAHGSLTEAQRRDVLARRAQLHRTDTDTDTDTMGA